LKNAVPLSLIPQENDIPNHQNINRAFRVDGFTPLDLQQTEVQEKHATVLCPYRLQNNRHRIDCFFGNRLCTKAFFFWNRINLILWSIFAAATLPAATKTGKS
jgi:hypothetical protein